MTAGELDLSLLLRLELSNVEISQILRISRGAVLTRTHRLRGRMGIDADTELLATLRAFDRD